MFLRDTQVGACCRESGQGRPLREGDVELRPEGGEEEERVPGGGNSNLEGSWVLAVLHGLRVTWLGMA